MIENDKFYEILMNSGVEVAEADQYGEADIELDSIRREIFDVMESHGMTIVVSRTEFEGDEKAALYLAQRVDYWNDVFKTRAAATPLAQEAPTKDQIESDAYERAEYDMEFAVGFQSTMIAITAELLYWMRNGGIENHLKTKMNFLTKTLVDFDIDLKDLDPMVERFIDLYNEMIPDEPTLL